MNLTDLINRIRALEAALAAGQQELLSDPHDGSLVINLETGDKLKRRLEDRLSELTKHRHIDVCRYRLSPDGGRGVRAYEFGRTLCTFQEAVGVTLDAIQTGKPKQQARIAPAAVKQSYFDFGYTTVEKGGEQSDGWLGFVLSIPNEVLLQGFSSTLDETMNTLFSMACADDTEQIFRYAQRVGSAPVRMLAQWSEAHIDAASGARVQWCRGSDVRQELAKTAEEWRQLHETIALVSDSTEETIEITGMLVAANIKTHRFVLENEEGCFAGRFRDAIGKERVASIPKRYHAKVRKLITTNFATNEMKTRFELVSLHDA